MSDADIRNLILHEIERWWAGRYAEKHGLVTAYDPERHLAKVTFQPDGQESGWLPIETGHIGNNFGILVGLTPGDGKKTGDQVVVRYQDGDIESGKVVQRVHSDQDKPPKVESGEICIWTRFTNTATPPSGIGDDTTDTGTGDQVGEQGGKQGSGQQIFFKKDGSITFTDGAGSTMVMDGLGNVTTTCQNMTDTVQGNHTHTVQGNRSRTVNGSDTVSIGGSLSKSVGGKRRDGVGGSWMSSAAGGLWGWLTAGSDTSD